MTVPPRAIRRETTGVFDTPVHRRKPKSYHLEVIAIALFVITAAALVAMKFIPACYMHHTFIPITATLGCICGLSLLAFGGLVLKRIR